MRPQSRVPAAPICARVTRVLAWGVFDLLLSVITLLCFTFFRSQKTHPPEHVTALVKLLMSGWMWGGGAFIIPSYPFLKCFYQSLSARGVDLGFFCFINYPISPPPLVAIPVCGMRRQLNFRAKRPGQRLLRLFSRVGGRYNNHMLPLNYWRKRQALGMAFHNSGFFY